MDVFMPNYILSISGLMLQSNRFYSLHLSKHIQQWQRDVYVCVFALASSNSHAQTHTNNAGLKSALGRISEFDCLVLKQDKSHKRYTK